MGEPAPACTFVKPDGSRCRVTFALSPDTQLCAVHDLARAEQLRAARHRGGATRAARQGAAKFRSFRADELPPPPETLEDIKAWAGRFTHGVGCGRVDSRTAEVVFDGLKTLRQTLDKLEIAATQQAHDRQLRALKRGRPRRTA